MRCSLPCAGQPGPPAQHDSSAAPDTNGGHTAHAAEASIPGDLGALAGPAAADQADAAMLPGSTADVDMPDAAPAGPVSVMQSRLDKLRQDIRWAPNSRTAA